MRYYVPLQRFIEMKRQRDDNLAKATGDPCSEHEYDPYSPVQCWKCGAQMPPVAK